MNPGKEKEILQKMDEVILAGPYKPDWDSLMENRVPEWFSQEKLGIFIHWGLYSVPAYSNEWYSRNMYKKDMDAFEHHRKTYGSQKEFGYKDFIPLFTAQNFHPEEWIELFWEAGAGYMFPVAEHHDGFQMYRSELSDWNVSCMGPGRDILGELKSAAEKKGIHFCTSSHRAEHWFFMGHGREFDSDVNVPLKKGDFYWPAMEEPDPEDLYSKPYPNREFMDDWLARTGELILNYQPKLLYFDWWIQHQAFKPCLKKLAAFYYNCGEIWKEPVSICYKHDAMMFGSGIVEMERGGFKDPKPYHWQMDTAVARNSWCYTKNLDYKSSSEIICTLADVVSKNGNLLLNIGPKADGSIPSGDKKILKDLGEWMKVNGEAIKGAKVWRKSEEGPVKMGEGQFCDQSEQVFTTEDYRFTANHGNIYAIALKSPKDGRFLIKSLGESKNQNVPEFHGVIEKVDILGYEGKLAWSVDESGLHILSDFPGSEFPVVIRVGVQ
ncbi:MAG: alpha-L-fucosidase [Roseburia sp.]|nr:alpha-L-fucosidase [Roseburia sp.]